MYKLKPVLYVASFLFLSCGIAVADEEDTQAQEMERQALRKINMSQNGSELIDMNSEIVATVGSVDFRECTVAVQGRDRKVQCAWYEVLENPQAVEGKKIPLFVVRIPAKRVSKNIADPMLFIAGGPGQAASETYLFADHMWRSLAKYRDFYLIDQRGTGYSNAMSCKSVMLNYEYSVEQEYDSEQVKALVRECLASMPGDARFYTTDITVDDFELARVALGIKGWNLLGVSYGTRVSTHYMRKYPASLRAVVLDSVVPPQHVLGEEIAFRSQNILDVLFARCEESKACDERMPNLRKEVSALFAKLKEAPVKIKVENFRTGEVEESIFTRDHLVTLVRLYLYSPSSLAVLPPMLYEAAVNGNFSPLARASNSIVESMSASMSAGLHNSVMCTEEFPYYALSEEERRATQASVMGMSLVDYMGDICAVWPKGETLASMKEPLVSDIPTLLVSGEFDPITPPEFAEQTLEHLGNAKHLVLSGQGHFVSATGCMPELVAGFISDLTFDTLNANCLDRVGAEPLFINFNGTAP